MIRNITDWVIFIVGTESFIGNPIETDPMTLEPVVVLPDNEQSSRDGMLDIQYATTPPLMLASIRRMTMPPGSIPVRVRDLHPQERRCWRRRWPRREARARQLRMARTWRGPRAVVAKLPEDRPSR